MISSAEIRSRFLEFYRKRGHTIVKSSSLLPGNDPTLLFVNSGMVQFKDAFLGLEKRAYTRAATAQKCMRVSGKHNDLEAVGPSLGHHTFFEMLGNFSFGDYFKAEAIDSAWTFLTEELGLDPQRLYPTVYVDDDEALRLWQEIAGVPASRVTRLGKKDNFWAMGDTGPCGPCSEIVYDRGPEACSCGRPDCSPAKECDRWLELWNLVFMQFDAREDGTVVPLPRPSIDTGLGMERIASILQGVDSNYETDLFLPIMRRTRLLLGHDETAMRANIVPYRIIADHSRAIAFLIADGVMPGNEGRGYVLRMILRRAAVRGRQMGFEGPFLAETAQAVIDTMGHHYAELVERGEFIREVINEEEERFLDTLDAGRAHLDRVIEGTIAVTAQPGRLSASGKLSFEATAALRTQPARLSAAGVVSGREAFDLYSTHGIPLEVTVASAADRGLSVDTEGFERAMAEERERGRSAQRFGIDAREELYRRLDLPMTGFVGYETCRADSHILAIVRDGARVAGAATGDEVEIVLAKTPFYAEAGGQVGDTGELLTATGRVVVTATVESVPGVIVHRGRVAEGGMAEGEEVTAIVDQERRLDAARNHTATHLLHRALRQVAGEHAAQSGSLVAPDRLRFDFAHLSPLSAEELGRVEAIVNHQIRANSPVTARESSFDDAVRGGAVALFGEKYGDRVRVVTVEGFSSELCGGTHLGATGQIGSFLIVGESSIGAGLRRIEALTGRGAETYIRGRMDALESLTRVLSARPGEELQRAEDLVEQLRARRRIIGQLQRQIARRDVDSLLGEAVEVKGAKVLAVQVEAVDASALREMCDRFRDRLGSAVVALGALVNERPLLVVGVTQDLVAKGLHAGELASIAAQRMGGGGGGRPNMAQAGGGDASRLSEALDALPPLVAESLD